MNDNTSLAVIVIGILTAVILGGALSDFHQRSKIKAGLEECRSHPDSRNTIWVKDCTEYIKLILNIEKEIK